MIFRTASWVLFLFLCTLFAGSSAAEDHPAPSPRDTIFELRQYTLHAGKRDVLISMFEKYFIEPQNENGANIYGVFRDLDDPDRFVWIRGFAGMPQRAKALAEFYGGPIWQSHRSEANPTMLDSDNVLFLKPLTSNDALIFRAPDNETKGSIVSAMIYYTGDVDPLKFAEYFDARLLPGLKKLHAEVLGQFVTEDAPNNFPKLPVREKEKVFVWIGRWNSPSELDVFLKRATQISGWRDSAPEALLPAFERKPEVLRLEPALRSPLK